MKLWVDDTLPPPNNTEYTHVHSVDIAIFAILLNEEKGCPYELIDMHHQSVDHLDENKNYTKILEWLEETKRDYPVHIHTNAVESQSLLERVAKEQNITLATSDSLDIVCSGIIY